MELFVQKSGDNVSLAVELFANYVRATSRKIVEIKHLSEPAINTLKVEREIPFLLKSNEETQ